MTDKIELTLEVKQETVLAFLVTDNDIEEWIPKGQISVIDKYEDEEENVIIEIEIPEWLAKDKELI